MGIAYIFNTVGYKLPRWKRVKHPIMAHGNTVVDRDGVELGGKEPMFPYLLLYRLSDTMEMNMTRNELGKGIRYCYHRLSELFLLHPVGSPETPGACHIPPGDCFRTSELNFHKPIILKKKLPGRSGKLIIPVLIHIIPGSSASDKDENKEKGNNIYQ